MRLLFLIVISLVRFSLLQAQDIIFTPQWLPQAQFAGYYVALEKGFYAEEGVDVEFCHPSSSYPAFNSMVDGNSDIITMQLPQAMVAIDCGFPLVNILQTSQHNSLLIVPGCDSISTLDDLRNKRVGIWKVGFGEIVKILDKQHDLNIEWIEYLNGINLLIAGAIDATLAMKYNEYWQIMASGITPKHVFPIAEYGLDVPEDGLYVSRALYEAHPDQVQAFARASRRGWEWVMDNPEESLDIVLKVMKHSNVSTNVHHQRWMLKEVLQLMCDEKIEPEKSQTNLRTKFNIQGEASFRLKPEHIKLANEVLFKAGVIRDTIDYHQIWKGEAQ